MRKVALFLNSPYLGGAERSILSQISSLRESRIDFYIPNIEGVDSNEVYYEVLKKFPNSKIEKYDYPRSLYKTSRSSLGKADLLLKVWGVIESFLHLRGLNLGKYDIIWTNGNKAAFPVYLYLLLYGFRNHFVWHFRDYPHNKGIFKIIWKLLGRPTVFKKTLLANSYSVEEALRDIIKSDECEYRTVYNPVGDVKRIPKESMNSSVQKIGVASMLAPWKGIHTIIQFEKMYREELKLLGINEISIYGGDIYATEGEHANYLSDLVKLDEKNSLIQFKGNQAPQEIFNNIDILIHSSLRPEPFGRVIIESFAARVSVLSTCLGGSGELVIENESGYKFTPYDYVGLYKKIKKLCSLEERYRLTDMAIKKLDEVEKQQEDFWANF